MTHECQIPRTARLTLLALAACAAAALFLGSRTIRSSAATFDEPLHLASGYTYWKTGRFELNIFDHPPFAEMWAAVPLLTLGPDLKLDGPEWRSRRQYGYAGAFLYSNNVDHEKLLDSARGFSFLTWTALLLLTAGWWAWRLRGRGAALWTVFLAALSPNIISNFALVTTDAAPTALFFASFCLLSAGRGARPGGVSSGRGPAFSGAPIGWAALAGVCAGLAVTSKFNMIVLPPMLAAAAVADRWTERREVRGAGAAVAAIAIGSTAVLLFVYGPSRLPLYWKGLWATIERLQLGRPCFLMGQHSQTGFWSYFPLAFLLKTPLATLGLGFLGTGLWLLRWRKERSTWWLVLPMLAYFLMTFSSKVQIGYRHLLPVYPFFLVLGGMAADWLFRRGRSGGALALALAVLQGVFVLVASPHLLTFFNAAAGGPARGHEHLVDSNLDWGQGLEPLARELERLGNPPVYLSYFGVAFPEAYGIDYVPFAMSRHILWRSRGGREPFEAGKVYLAVSATHYRGVYSGHGGIFDWLQTRKPVALAGNSIFLFDLTKDPEGIRRLAGMLKADGKPARAAALLRWMRGGLAWNLQLTRGPRRKMPRTVRREIPRAYP